MKYWLLQSCNFPLELPMKIWNQILYSSSASWHCTVMSNMSLLYISGIIKVKYYTDCQSFLYSLLLLQINLMININQIHDDMIIDPRKIHTPTPPIRSVDAVPVVTRSRNITNEDLSTSPIGLNGLWGSHDYHCRSHDLLHLLMIK